MSEDEIRTLLEGYGPAQVRLLLQTGGLPTQFNPAIMRWLAEKDQEAERLKGMSAAERAAIDARIVAAAERQSAAVETQAIEARRANRRASIAIASAIALAAANAALTIILRSMGH